MAPSTAMDLRNFSLRVVCGPHDGRLDPKSMQILCCCAKCAPTYKTFTLGQWEIHGGRGHCRNAKSSIRVVETGKSLHNWLRDRATAEITTQAVRATRLRGSQGSPPSHGAEASQLSLVSSSDDWDSDSSKSPDMRHASHASTPSIRLHDNGLDLLAQTVERLEEGGTPLRPAAPQAEKRDNSHLPTVPAAVKHMGHKKSHPDAVSRKHHGKTAVNLVKPGQAARALPAGDVQLQLRRTAGNEEAPVGKVAGPTPDLGKLSQQPAKAGGGAGETAEAHVALQSQGAEPPEADGNIKKKKKKKKRKALLEGEDLEMLLRQDSEDPVPPPVKLRGTAPKQARANPKEGPSNASPAPKAPRGSLGEGKRPRRSSMASTTGGTEGPAGAKRPRTTRQGPLGQPEGPPPTLPVQQGAVEARAGQQEDSSTPLPGHPKDSVLPVADALLSQPAPGGQKAGSIEPAAPVEIEGAALSVPALGTSTDPGRVDRNQLGTSPSPLEPESAGPAPVSIGAPLAASMGTGPSLQAGEGAPTRASAGTEQAAPHQPTPTARTHAIPVSPSVALPTPPAPAVARATTSPPPSSAAPPAPSSAAPPALASAPPPALASTPEPGAAPPVPGATSPRPRTAPRNTRAATSRLRAARAAPTAAAAPAPVPEPEATATQGPSMSAAHIDLAKAMYQYDQAVRKGGMQQGLPPMAILLGSPPGGGGRGGQAQGVAAQAMAPTRDSSQPIPSLGTAGEPQATAHAPPAGAVESKPWCVVSRMDMIQDAKGDWVGVTLELESDEGQALVLRRLRAVKACVEAHGLRLIRAAIQNPGPAQGGVSVQRPGSRLVLELQAGKPAPRDVQEAALTCLVEITQC
ncbi:hypothetical protein ACKKBF_B35685 [Auxenochlorella protothecoides x Auxenochlorella symbiontica]